MSQLSLAADVESIVLAMWGEPEEEITREVMARFDITYEHALETVKAAITAELDYDQEGDWFYEDDGQPDEAQEWYDFDPDC